jgi:hypothetical protein
LAVEVRYRSNAFSDANVASRRKPAKHEGTCVGDFTGDRDECGSTFVTDHFGFSERPRFEGL